MKLKENSKVGWILQVDLEYPEELKDSHNSYPLKSEKKGDRVQADVGIPKRNDGRYGAGLPETGAYAVGQKQLRRPLQEPGVLPQAGDAFEKGQQGDLVRARAVDRVLHPEFRKEARSEF